MVPNQVLSPPPWSLNQSLVAQNKGRPSIINVLDALAQLPHVTVCYVSH